MKTVTIYTDGACSGNPGPGGWGAILEYQGVERELSGGEEKTTITHGADGGPPGTAVPEAAVYRGAVFGFKICDRRAAKRLGHRLAQPGLAEGG